MKHKSTAKALKLKPDPGYTPAPQPAPDPAITIPTRQFQIVTNIGGYVMRTFWHTYTEEAFLEACSVFASVEDDIQSGGFTVEFRDLE